MVGGAGKKGVGKADNVLEQMGVGRLPRRTGPCVDFWLFGSIGFFFRALFTLATGHVKFDDRPGEEEDESKNLRVAAGKFFSRTKAVLHEPSFRVRVAILAVIMEPIRHLHKYFLKASQTRQDFTSAPDICDLLDSSRPGTQFLFSRLVLHTPIQQSVVCPWCLSSSAPCGVFNITVVPLIATPRFISVCRYSSQCCMQILSFIVANTAFEPRCVMCHCIPTWLPLV
jgi:hypothetical protein